MHHIFPRSLTRSSSYFVEITDGPVDDHQRTVVIPHAVGLCGSGTTGHHGDVEEHRAWIKLEDGVYVWYDRGGEEKKQGWLDDPEYRPLDFVNATWDSLGPLNPQPGSVEGKPKRKRFKGEARRKRKTISIRVPDDAGEDGAALLDEAVEELEKKISRDNPRPIYFTVKNALDYTLLNADATDFE